MCGHVCVHARACLRVYVGVGVRACVRVCECVIIISDFICYDVTLYCIVTLEYFTFVFGTLESGLKCVSMTDCRLTTIN